MTEINEKNFEQEVLKSKEPVLVDFWADWCGPCKMLAPILTEIDKERSGTLKVVKVNIDENPTLASQHKITSIPTLMFFYNGAKVGEKIGVSSKKAILQYFDGLIP